MRTWNEARAEANARYTGCRGITLNPGVVNIAIASLCSTVVTWNWNCLEIGTADPSQTSNLRESAPALPCDGDVKFTYVMAGLLVLSPMASRLL